MGQTRVDLQHLLEDLRDAYPDAIEETILSEVVANALDSGARAVRVLTDPSEKTLVVVDDGSAATPSHRPTAVAESSGLLWLSGLRRGRRMKLWATP